MAQQKPKSPLFGRKPDLEYLHNRAANKGLTTIVGRPQSGKTWLLETLRDELANTDNTLVGYAESTGQYADLLLRSLKDLYTRWLSDASYLKQAQAIWNQNKDTLITRGGKTIGGALGKILEGQTGAAGMGDLVRGFFNGLHTVNRDLLSGGINLPVLDYDQAHDLMWLLDHLSGEDKRFVLILDAFEQSGGTQVEAGTLERFLSRLDQWPHCHILLAARKPDANEKESEALLSAKRLAAASMAATVWDLPGLHLTGDLDEIDALAQFLNDRVPATVGIPNDRLLELIGGHAGVIDRWVASQGLPDQTPASKEDLAGIARDAHAHRYPELAARLGDLKKTAEPALRYAIRLALLPEFQTEEDFGPLSSILLNGMAESPLADLQSSGLLEEDARAPRVPTYGHKTRYDAARSLIFTDERYRPFAREEAESLAVELASQVSTAEPRVVPYAEALRQLGLIAPDQVLTAPYAGLCVAAASLLRPSEIGSKTSSACPYLRASAGLAATTPGVAEMVAMGLYNLNADSIRGNCVEQVDQLFDGLRKLARHYPANNTVQECLAMSLVNMGLFIKEENNLGQGDQLIAQLRTLAANNIENNTVRECLAKGLFNACVSAEDKNDLARRDHLIGELRTLSEDNPEDGVVQDRLAIALGRKIAHVMKEHGLPQGVQLIKELKTLKENNPENNDVQEFFALLMADLYARAKEKNDLPKREAQLKELRELLPGLPPGQTKEILLRSIEDLRQG